MKSTRCYLCNSDDYMVIHKHRNDRYERLIKYLDDYGVRVCVCKHCGLVYQNPRPDKYELAQIYAEKYRSELNYKSAIPVKEYLNDTIVRNRKHIAFLENHIDLSGKTKRVLDIGSAAGSLLNFFKDRGWECFGVEPTISFADFSRKQYGHTIFNGFFEDIKFGNLKFDLITFTGTLEHVLEPVKFLEKAKEILKEDGFMYFEVPNIYKPIGYLSQDYFSFPHIYTFSPSSIKMVFYKASLSVDIIDDSSEYILGLASKKIPELSKDWSEDWRVIKKHIFRYRIRYFLKIHWKDIVKNCLSRILGEQKFYKFKKNNESSLRRGEFKTHPELICPQCKTTLDNGGEYYSCACCGKNFPIFNYNATAIIDFVNIKNSCYCKKLEVDECKIDLSEDLKKIASKTFKSQEIANYKSRLIKKWAGYNNKILDLGCREAPYGLFLSENNEVYGLDICAKAMLFGERKGITDSALNKNYKCLFIADCLHIPVADKAFDVVVATDILEHIIENKQFMQEVSRVLKDKGALIISVPNLASIYNRISLFFGNADGFMPWNIFYKKELFDESLSISYPPQDIHLRFFTIKSLKRIIALHNFKIVQYSGIDFNPFFARVPELNRIFANLCAHIIILAEKSRPNPR